MENKKTKIVSIIAIIALVLTLISATYAYFQAQTGEGSQADVKINANTVDTLTFETGGAISLSLDQISFAQGAGNKTGNTFAKAMLTANNKTNSATEHYYLYLNISSNTFTYTQGTDTPEILLSIKDGSNNEITTLTGLTYKTVTDGKGASIKGFDITTKKGLITILNNREITTTSTKTEEWNVTVTFVNYNSNQAGNAGKNFNAKLMIQKEKLKETAATVCSNGQTLSSCIIAMDGKDDTLYHHTSSLTNGAGDNSYRYAGGDYVLTDAGKATGATMITGYNNTVTTALIDFYCDGTKQYVGYGCSSSATQYYLIKGNTTQYQSYKESLNASVEKGYLTKDNVKNFVCFGSNASPCPIDNLYRIVGVFGDNYHGVSGKQLVKLIKYDYAKSDLLGTDGDCYILSPPDAKYYIGNLTSIDTYYWNYKASGSSNTWDTSLLNKINLNANFINSIGSTWADKIATVTWKAGGNTNANIAPKTPSVAYINEVTSPIENTTVNTKIGLIYASDYGYAADPSTWITSLYNYGGSINSSVVRILNWMSMGAYEWTITRVSDISNYVLSVNPDGGVGFITVNFGFAVRPAFNLESSITYVSGSGSMSDPILIN